MMYESKPMEFLYKISQNNRLAINFAGLYMLASTLIGYAYMFQSDLFTVAEVNSIFGTIPNVFIKYFSQNITIPLLGSFFISLFLCIDLVVEEVTSSRFVISFIRNKRHIIYMVLAILTISFSITFTMVQGFSFNILRCVVDGLLAVCLAYVDLVARRTEGRTPL